MVFVYTWCRKAVYIEDIPHRICLNNDNLTMPSEIIEWCDLYCVSKWGWFYTNESLNIGFADQDEKTLFCLSNNYC